MNCQSVQNRILSLPDPRQVPDALRAHLDACPECVRWWRQAARLERLLSELPAPPAPAGKKEALIDELTAAGPVIKSVPSLGRSVPSPGLAFLRRNWKPVAGLAAAVLVVVGGWQLFSGSGSNGTVAHASTPQHHLVTQLVDRCLELRKARSPEKKIELLGAIADDLTAETRALARVSNGDEMDNLADWFEKTVGKGIDTQAKVLEGGRTLTPAERDARVKLLTDLAAKLSATASEVGGLVKESPEKARPGLNRIVNQARSGQDKLQNLAKGM